MSRSKPPLTFRDMLLKASKALQQDDLQAAQTVAGATVAMADLSVSSDALNCGIEEAVARMPKSPTVEWGRPMKIPRGDRLNVPMVSHATVGTVGNAAPMLTLSLELPLDDGALVQLDDDALMNAHRFLHTIDILAWENGHLNWVHEYRVQFLAWQIALNYRDPFFGTIGWAQLCDEHVLLDHHHRQYILTQAVEMIQREREIKAAQIMSTIDKEVIRRGLDRDASDYWRV